MNKIQKILCLFILSITPLFSITIKMGTLAPEGTPWSKAMHEISKEWNRISGGSLRVKIYFNGIAGSEEAMIRKMKGARSSLQSAALTSVGMNKISPEVLALSIPMLVRNDEEMAWLVDKMAPILDKRIEEKGFKVLAWLPAGWVNIFSTEPVLTPDDLKELKLAVEVKEVFIRGWKKAGFHAVPVHTVDTMAGLQSGMVEAFYAPPLVAASYQWFGIAQNMCTLPIAPMLGGFIISNSAWAKIPDDLKPKLLEATKRVLKPVYAETKKLEEEAINVMLENGLKINNINEEQEKLWQETILKSYEVFIGTAFPEDVYNMIDGYLREYRSGKTN